MTPSAVTVTHGDGTNWTLVAILIASSPARYVHGPRVRTHHVRERPSQQKVTPKRAPGEWVMAQLF